MKARKPLVAVAIVGLLITAAATADASLVAHWALDESSGTTGAGSVADSGQFGFNGAPTGGTTFGQAGANANTGTSVNMSNASIDVAYDGMLNPGSFTFTAWAYLDSSGSSYRSVVTSRDSTGNDFGYIIYAMPDNTWSFWTGNGPAAGGWQALSGGAAATDTWTHLAISFDAETNTKSLYINGGTPVTTTTQGYVPNAHDGLHIGGGGDTGTSYRFVGNIDDASLWNTALSQAEIQAIMNDSVPGQPAQRLEASFDLSNDGTAFVGVGPFGGPNTAASTFVEVNAQGTVFTDNGISVRVLNSTAFSNGSGGPSELTNDYLYDTGGSAQGNWEITGLDPDSVYDLYIVASNGSVWSATNVYGADYTMTVGTADQTTLRATGGTTEAFQDFVDGRDYVIFTGVRPDASGMVAGTYNQISGQPHTGIAGFQVVLATPEPASYAMLLGLTGMGGLSYLVRRRRRK